MYTRINALEAGLKNPERIVNDERQRTATCYLCTKQQSHSNDFECLVVQRSSKFHLSILDH